MSDTAAAAATDSSMEMDAAIILSKGATTSSSRAAPGNSIKSIDNLGSFALITNNCVGPAMLGIPRLFQQAGIVPVLLGIAFMFMVATLGGTLFADTIASIPGNRSFSKNLSFSSAFRIIIGEEVYIFAETLFLITCGVQAIASIVAAAQSIDGLLASLIMGRTYALTVLPTFELIVWYPDLCHANPARGQLVSASSEASHCTPFHGDGTMLVTLGFVLTTLLFLPMGRGLLKETIAVQVAAFGVMVVLLTQFTVELVIRGFPVHVPLFGSHLSELAGVVLFNYAFIVAVPSWLAEKEAHVSVNAVLWSSSLVSSLCYVLFGVMASMSFQEIGVNALVMLTSTKVHYFTRICAGLFGILIIGSGVPVFCVLIRMALERNRICSPGRALFVASILPYLVAWALYQGSLLMTVLNWTGLVVNGCVSFLLPMILVLKSIEYQYHQHPGMKRRRRQDHLSDRTDTDEETAMGCQLHEETSTAGDEAPVEAALLAVGGSDMRDAADEREAGDAREATAVHDGDDSEGESDDSEGERVYPLPSFMEPYRREIVVGIIAVFVVIIGLTLVVDSLS